MAEKLSGKTVLITGSTDGLGKMIARHLARQNAIVLLHGRNKKKGEEVLAEIVSESGNNRVSYYNGDFSSFEEVTSLSEMILRENKHIDILINNVGIGRGLPSENRQEFSTDGIELRLAVNYLSHVLLTEKLLPALKANSSLIINVASIGQEPIDFKNLMLDSGYDGFIAYKRSKTALIMYTFDLAQRLKEKGINVNAVHPASLMNTNMVLNDWGYSYTTVEQGAEAVESLLFSDKTGSYYDGRSLSKAIAQTYNPEARELLKSVTWKLLEKYI